MRQQFRQQRKNSWRHMLLSLATSRQLALLQQQGPLSARQTSSCRRLRGQMATAMMATLPFSGLALAQLSRTTAGYAALLPQLALG